MFPELATLPQGRSLLNPVVSSCFVGHLRHHIAIKSAQQVATRATFELCQCSKMPMRCVTCKDSSTAKHGARDLSARWDRKQLSRHYHSKAAKISKLIFDCIFFLPLPVKGERKGGRDTVREGGVVKRVARRLLAVAHYLSGSDCRLLPLTGRDRQPLWRDKIFATTLPCHMPHATCPSCRHVVENYE